MRALSQTLAVARKDLVLEFRTKESLNAALAFSLVILVLFSFTVDPAGDALREMTGGLLWLAFLFAGALVFNRGFAREVPNECLDVLLASPLSSAGLLVGKAITSFVLLLLVEAISLPVFGILYNTIWWRHPWQLLGVFALASWGVAIVGAVFGALTINLRLRELMLPVLIYPLLIPLVMAAIELTNNLITGQGISNDSMIWVRLLVVFDIVFTALTLALAETILVN